MHVDFFIAGVQKGATTALDSVLRRHPGVEMAAQKEPHFFDDESMDWSMPNYAQLHRFYNSATTERLRGEATPIYTYWPQALERLRGYNPAAKLIVGLRHPAFRAFSHWRMEVSRGAEALDFSTSIREGRKRVAEAPAGVHRVYSYVERGYYADQIARLHRLFPKEQLCIYRADQLWRAPQDELARLLRFLGLAPTILTTEAEYIVPIRSRSDLVFLPEDRRYLDELFAADIRATAAISGLDLLDWLEPDYVEPMNGAQEK